MKAIKTVSTFTKPGYKRIYLIQFRYLSSLRTIQARFPERVEGNKIFWKEWKEWLKKGNRADLLKAISEGRWNKQTANQFLRKMAKEIRKSYWTDPKSPFRELAIS